MHDPNFARSPGPRTRLARWASGIARVGLASTALLHLAGPVAAQGYVEDLGSPGGPGTALFVRAVSDDGRVVAGSYRDAGNRTHGFVWREGVGFTEPFQVLSLQYTYSEITDLSADGRVAIGWAGTSSVPLGSSAVSEAYTWTEANGLQSIVPLDGVSVRAARALSMSADGQTVHGFVVDASGSTFGNYRAFWWSAATTTAVVTSDLGPVSIFTSIPFVTCSDDGSETAGHCHALFGMPPTYGPAIFHSRGPSYISNPTSFSMYGVRAISADGSTVVGGSGLGSVGWRWTPTGGLQTSGFGTAANAVSSDGSVVAGTMRVGSQNRAYRLEVGSSPVDLGTSTGHGSSAVLMTPDAQVIIAQEGVRLPNGTIRGSVSRWTSVTGMVNYGFFPGTVPTHDLVPTALSTDGNVVVGQYGDRVFRLEFLDDRDGDAIPDAWEVSGLPYVDAIGVTRLLLDVDNNGVSDASPLRKDVFVEVDAMAGRAPSPVAIDRVKFAFLSPQEELVPPVPGLPGALPNIALHVQTSPEHLALQLTNNGVYENGLFGWESDFAADKLLYFGTPREQDSPDWPDILAKKRVIFRYCIFADKLGTTDYSGAAEGRPCDDFVVTLGTFKPPGGTVDAQAGTFMHELGHALGLGHGGGDDINFKPNYVSIMNYWWQQADAWQEGEWRLRYSSAAMQTLDEHALDEVAGVGFGPPVPIPFGVTGNISCSHLRPSDFGPIGFTYSSMDPPYDGADWDGDCAVTPGVVAADINNLDPSGAGLQVLEGHDDWINLSYRFTGSPSFLPGAPAVDLGCRFSGEVRSFLSTLPGALGETYCTAAVNSTGLAAVISAAGRTTVADDRLTLIATRMPAHAFGFFLASRAQDFVPGSGGSQGNLCLGGPIGRGVGGAIFTSGELGAASLAADLQAMPVPGGFVAVQPGETWYFQAWFRDANPSVTSNLTDAIGLTFD